MEGKLRLIGSRITKIHAERNSDHSGKVTMNTGINIAHVEKYVPQEGNIDAIKVACTLKTDYSNLGLIEIHGDLFFTSDKETLDNIEKQFNDKNFTSKEMIAITNLVIQKFSIKAFELEEELGLPIHIKLPSLKPEEQPKPSES